MRGSERRGKLVTEVLQGKPGRNSFFFSRGWLWGRRSGSRKPGPRPLPAAPPPQAAAGLGAPPGGAAAWLPARGAGRGGGAGWLVKNFLRKEHGLVWGEFSQSHLATRGGFTAAFLIVFPKRNNTGLNLKYYPVGQRYNNVLYVALPFP